MWRDSGQETIVLGRGGAYVRTFDVFKPSPTRDSASLTAAATPSTTGAPVLSSMALSRPAIQSELGLPDDRIDHFALLPFELQDAQARRSNGGAVV